MSGSHAGPHDAAVAALQAALAAEEAASYGYGVVGSHLAGAQQQAARTDWVAHQVARDQLTAMVSKLGAMPVPSAVAYALPAPVRSARQARALAVTLEDRVTQAYIALVAVSDPGLREYGAREATRAALRAAAWRGSTQAFPGLPAASLT
ncbi:MAG: DUF4439 domain-containing protein [Streptosporangiaceae bacterium]